MAPDPRFNSADEIKRNALFAVELVDPVTQTFVYGGMTVRAEGLVGDPIVSRSGRFVWLEEGNAWPGIISVSPWKQPYASEVAAPLARPANLATAKAAERVKRITLRPTPAYDFGDRTTAIRGWLCEDPQDDSLAVVGARVQLAWRNQDHQYHPAPPVAAGDETLSPKEVETNAQGEFAVFLNHFPINDGVPDIEKGLLAVRLQVTRGRDALATRVTRDDFQFLTDQGLNPASRAGRVYEGRLLARSLRLNWSELAEI